MEKSIQDFIEKIAYEAGETRFFLRIHEEGKVLSVGDGIARVSGLNDARLYELLEFASGGSGIVFDLESDSIGVVLLTEQGGIKACEEVRRTGQTASVNAGGGLLGRVVDALGNPAGGEPEIGNTIPYPIEREAPPIIKRDYVSRPLLTGIKIIDSMFPIGRGQRELIIGDSSTGKTSICVDAIINQKNSDVISIYAAIGLKKTHVLKIIEDLKTYGDFSRTIVLAAYASDSLGMQYIAPYSAMAMAEYFMDKGLDVLLVLDDLTKHAEAYRSLSLLLGRHPGREAYPGDIFFIHARLLERSARIAEEYGGGSITSLPIAETQQGRISSYIPTNLISITDGQIYLDAQLFDKGFRPAIDVGKSVSRIGGRAQIKALREVTERLKIDYSRFLEMEVFTKFGAHLEEETSKALDHGIRLREMLKQPRFHPFSIEDEVMIFWIINSGVLDKIESHLAEKAAMEILSRAKRAIPQILERIKEKGALGLADHQSLNEFILHNHDFASGKENS
ncbi:MAG: F0F1 ATP synthase subunit alpha [Actinomycetota bacterium]|nr:F0F1 ATP synthase subunit alpha [Actinomycetota bacterium]